MTVGERVVCLTVIREPHGSIVLPGTHGKIRGSLKRLDQELWEVEWDSGERCGVFPEELEMEEAKVT